MAKNIVVEKIEGSENVKVAAVERFDYKLFREVYVPSMKAAGGEFDKAGEFYTLSQDAWGKVAPVLTSAGLTVGEGTIPAKGDKIVKLNATEKFAFGAVRAHLAHLVAVIDGGSMTNDDKAAIKKIMKTLS